MAKVTVTHEQINAWNRLFEATKGTPDYALFSLGHEYKNVNGGYYFVGWGGVRNNMIRHECEQYYIKIVRGVAYLYWEYLGDTERWLLSDLAMAYFNVSEAE